MLREIVGNVTADSDGAGLDRCQPWLSTTTILRSTHHRVTAASSDGQGIHTPDLVRYGEPRTVLGLLNWGTVRASLTKTDVVVMMVSSSLYVGVVLMRHMRMAVLASSQIHHERLVDSVLDRNASHPDLWAHEAALSADDTAPPFAGHGPW